MEATLSALGITKEELLDRLVERLADGWDDDGDEPRYWSAFEAKLTERINTAVAGVVDAAAQKSIEERVAAVLDGPWPNTNQYGEKRGAPQTFRELVMVRVDAYLNRKVRQHDGMPDDSYSSSGAMSRVDWLIAKAAEGAVKNGVEKAAKEAAEKARTEVLGAMDKAVVAAVRNVLGVR